MYHKRTGSSFQESGLFNLGQGECLCNKLAREKVAKVKREEGEAVDEVEAAEKAP